MVTFSFFVFLVSITHLANGAKILAFFPFPGKSHHILFRPIIQRLADRGHQVTYYTAIPTDKPHSNIKLMQLPHDKRTALNSLTVFRASDVYMHKMVKLMCERGILLGNASYGTEEVQKLIHSDEKFDLIMMETLFSQEPVASLMHKFNAIGVDIAPLGDYSWANELTGVSENPAYMVDFKSSYSDQMSFFEKLHNAYLTYISLLGGYTCRRKFQNQMDEFFNYSGWETRPPIGELMADISLVLMNSHHSTNYPTPTAPHVKHIGGAHINRQQPLPKDIQSFMDNANDGVIYFSFGSILNMTDFTNHVAEFDLINLFGSLKQRVLWKWASDVFPKVPHNIKMSKWFPQQAILAHNNTKMFISHGGYFSVSEAVYFGIPVIGIPFFADQPKNMIQVHSKGYGILLDRRNVTASSLNWAVQEILTKPRYKAEIMKRSALFKDRQMEPLDEAVYWIEYVLKHGKVLQPKGAHLSFWAMHMLDVYGTIIILIYVAYAIIKYLIYSSLNKHGVHQIPKTVKTD